MNENDLNIKADLHLHTNYSDGIFSPEELLQKAKQAGISFLSITDHDNVDAIEEAIEIGTSLGIEVIPGVELSAEMNDHEVHILGYFFDYRNQEFEDYLKRFRRHRIERAKKIVKKLNCLNVPLSYDDVMDVVKGDVSVGRPHVAYALQNRKFVESYYEAFAKYLADEKPAYVKKENITPKQALQLIANAGGLSFIAHPGKTVKTDEIFEMIHIGIDGIEIIHPSHSDKDTSYLQAIAGQYFLLESGGSDFHGARINEERNLGKYYVSEKNVEAMKRRLFH